MRRLLFCFPVHRKPFCKGRPSRNPVRDAAPQAIVREYHAGGNQRPQNDQIQDLIIRKIRPENRLEGKNDHRPDGGSDQAAQSAENRHDHGLIRDQIAQNRGRIDIGDPVRIDAADETCRNRGEQKGLQLDFCGIESQAHGPGFIFPDGLDLEPERGFFQKKPVAAKCQNHHNQHDIIKKLGI